MPVNFCAPRTERVLRSDRFYLPLSGEGKFPRSRAGLHSNVGFLYAAGEKLLSGAGHEGRNHGFVPAGMNDADAEAGAIMLLGGWTFQRHDEVIWGRRCSC